MGPVQAILFVVALAGIRAASAQSLDLYSEFIRIDPFGEVVRADRPLNGDAPREILSPALPRNAFTAFHLAVGGAAGTEYDLYIGQNPQNAVEATLYREVFSKVGAEWIPDALEPVQLPYHGKVGGDSPLPGQAVDVFWLDLHVSREAAVARIKIEPEVRIDGRWIRYPVEARIVSTAAPAIGPANVALPPIATPSDFSARAVLKRKLCESRENVPAEFPLTIRSMIVRDAAQDLAMASVVPVERLWEKTGARDRPKVVRFKCTGRARFRVVPCNPRGCNRPLTVVLWY